MKGRIIGLICLLVVFINTSNSQYIPIYEMRGAWIATVENIDWPSKKGLTANQQKAEFIQLINTLEIVGINAVFVQIRPVADALYKSKYEPWSEYLSGKQGVEPEAGYDPLQFMIEECHKRHIEFHAWINPYRAVFNINSSSIHETHVTRLQPHWFFTYGDKKYFNPGLPEVRKYIVSIVHDIIEHYQVDAIHMDDYFYPYPINNKPIPDRQAYLQFGRGLPLEDWRRSNCDSIVENIYTCIKKFNKKIKFGISPFGVWRNMDKDPEGSNTKAGLTNYDDLYADILLWLKKGWMDYVVPQLYWERGHRLCDFDTLLEWWTARTFGKHLYIGHAIERAGKSGGWKKSVELPNEIHALREFEDCYGSVYFSSNVFKKNPFNWNDSLCKNYYKYPALVPPMPWIDSLKPNAPQVEVLTETKAIKLTSTGKIATKGFAILQQPNPQFGMKFEPHILKIVYGKEVKLDYEELKALQQNKILVATISEGNNLSTYLPIIIQ